MIKGLLAIVGSFLLLKYRERVVAFTGKFGWAEQYLGMGGTYNLMVIIAVILFLWGIASITGTTDVLLAPLRMFFPRGAQPTGGGAGGF